MKNRTNQKIKIKGTMKSGDDFDNSELILTSGEFSSDCSHFDLIEIFGEEK